MTTDVLYNQDCLEGMRTLPSESIDCVVTDCPYKICAGGVSIEERADEMGGVMRKRTDSKHVSLCGVLNDKQVIRSNSRIGDKWVKADQTAVPSAVRNGKMFAHNDIAFSEWLPDVYRVLKQGTHCYIMVNARNLKELQTEAEKAGFVFQNLLVWDKGTATPNKYFMQGLEFILLLSKRAQRTRKRTPCHTPRPRGGTVVQHGRCATRQRAKGDSPHADRRGLFPHIHVQPYQVPAMVGDTTE